MHHEHHVVVNPNINAPPACPPHSDGIFPYIALIREQQLALSLPDLLKLDMAGYEFFSEANQLVHLSKEGQCAMGAAMAYTYYAYQQQQPAPSVQARL
jgi:hypothetical protein